MKLTSCLGIIDIIFENGYFINLCILLFLLLPLCLFSDGGIDSEVKQKPEDPRGPWLTGPLLTLLAFTVPIDSYNIEPYVLNMHDLGCFLPSISSDTRWFATELLPVVKGKIFLEIGSGTGAIACLAMLEGAKNVTATDINPTR